MKLTKYKIAVVAALFPVAAWAWPWSTDMVDQPAIKPQKPVDGEMMAFPSRSIPVGGLPTTYTSREETRGISNPIPATRESIAEGRTLFKIYCATCHGPAGSGVAPVGQKIGAIPLNDSYVQETLTEGWIFGTITFGSFIMPAYGMPGGREDMRGSNDLSVEERWHVVNYIRNGMLNDTDASATRTAGAQAR